MPSASQSNRAGSQHLFTAGAGRTRGRGTSRIALLLSLMLVAGVLTVPALAKPVEPGIISPTTGELFESGAVITLEAQADNGTKEIAWEVWLGAPGADEDGPLESGDGEDGSFDRRSGSFDGEVTLGDDTSTMPSSNEYYFVFIENPDTPRETTYQVQFAVFENVDRCDDGADCRVDAEDGTTGQSFTATAPGDSKSGGQSGLGLGLADPADGSRVGTIADAVETACQDLLEDNQRLAGAVSHLLPVDFDGGDVTVDLLIPRSVIDDGTNKGTTSFQVCIAPDDAEKDLYSNAGYSDLGDLGNTGLVGPILLHDCDLEADTACIESRERTNEESGDLLITYRIPAVDPWMM